MTADEVLKNLKAMIGKEIDFDDVVCAFEDFEEYKKFARNRGE